MQIKQNDEPGNFQDGDVVSDTAVPGVSTESDAKVIKKITKMKIFRENQPRGPLTGNRSKSVETYVRNRCDKSHSCGLRTNTKKKQHF